MQRRPFVAGNWKMYGTRVSVTALLDALDVTPYPHIETAVLPPAIYIPQVAEILSGSLIAWGAQNISTEVEGAFTGEISAKMLTEFNCRYALVGHSERRRLYQEDDQQIARKFAVAQELGLTPILCVGETLEQREQGQTFAVIEQQLQPLLALAPKAAVLAKAIIAYEPVWAIGTGKTATDEQAQTVHAMIRQWVAAQDEAIANTLRIIYGGSVKADNAHALFAMPDIDGGLIGGASLQAKEFLAICAAAEQAHNFYT